MYLSNSDGGDVDDNVEAQQSNTMPVTSAPSQSPSVSHPALLVIDDNSSSNESSANIIDIPSTSTPSSTTIQINHPQVVTTSPVPNNDAANDTPEQQRRRNSSIAKLLGGQPLNNQQYEEIHQQILDDQSAQNGLNDNGTDSGIPRSRSSITRSLLMSAERNITNNNMSTNAPKARAESPEFSKNFEYLIRRELDIEHAPLTLHPGSAPSVFQNHNSARNTPPTRSSPPSQLKLKRKRSIPKPILSGTSLNKPSNPAPFALRDPFELDSSNSSLAPPLNSPVLHRSHHQNDLFRFDTPHRHSRQLAQQYPMAMNSSPAGNSSIYSNHKLNLNSSVYSQFTIHPDRLPPPSSSSYSYCHYPPPTELTLPTPVSSLTTPSLVPPHPIGLSSRKMKAMHRPDLYDMPIQRSYANMSNQSNLSTSSFSSAPSSPSDQSAPFKKRLLHAYNNEQRPSSSL